MVASVDPTLEIAIEPMFALPSTHEMRNASDRCTCLRSSGSTRAVQQINGCCTMVFPLIPEPNRPRVI
jgi:hypothetical protein